MSNRFTGDLKFIGLSEDSEHLIVSSPNGENYRLRITPMVRAAVRVDRSAMEAAKAEHDGTLPPREIQMRIRSGMTAQEISEKSNVSLELVQRYEGPVLAERQYMAETAQKSRLSSEPDAPTLGHIVLDRLASRGVNTLDLYWDAYKTAAHGWIVSVTFDLDSDIRVARWTYKQSAKQVTAIDEESKWLSETRIADEPIPRRRLSAVRSGVFDFEASDEQSTISPVLQNKPKVSTSSTPALNSVGSETEALLEKLDSVRGTRNHVSLSTPSRSEENAVMGTVHSLPVDSSKEVDVVFDAESSPAEENTLQRPASNPQSAHTDEADNLHSNNEQWAPEHTPLTSAISALTLSESGTSPEPLTRLNSDHNSTSTVNANSRHSLSPRSALSPKSAPDPRDIYGPLPTPSKGIELPQPDAQDLFGEENPGKQAAQTSRRGKSKGRSPMPSWDEIMFGSRPE